MASNFTSLEQAADQMGAYIRVRDMLHECYSLKADVYNTLGKLCADVSVTVRGGVTYIGQIEGTNEDTILLHGCVRGTNGEDKLRIVIPKTSINTMVVDDV